MSATHETPQPASEPPRRKILNSRFWIGLVLGVFLGLFAGILLYIVHHGSVRIMSARDVCAAKLNCIGKAIAMYHAENEDLPAVSPENLVRTKAASWRMFVCPSAIHELGDDEDNTAKDADYVLIPLEGNAPEMVAAVFELPANHLQQRCNFCRADSSVAYGRPSVELLPAVQQANDYHAELRGKP